MRKYFKPFIILFCLLLGTGIVLAIRQPLVLKTILGQGNFIGKPVAASVFTDGEANNSIKVYKEDDFLLLYKDSTGVIGIDLKNNWVGTPVSLSSRDYVIFYGYLFQSEPGGIFVRYNDGAKRIQKFNPNLQIEHNTIRFHVTPEEKKFNCDSVRIEL